MYLKAYWFEQEPEQHMRNLPSNSSELPKEWINDVTMKIAKAIVQKQLNLKNAFLVFDRDQDKQIDYNDFETTVLGTLAIKINADEVDFYFRKIEGPLS